ncbi:PREDICTED: elongation of very long chain fatty acids protein AAEL008004-like [Dinoponera quadriceps]|uniref:Elongation of very long chain fatty acids protein n=1 Tax=Dinoponera quadriceps TaxID=609295 RepID=A0A6P3XJW1_DINQU|nr:PREDICTED: elongation of very long chain fatty acids protein AAEL008004-like [Dinoponera quadriceps]
MDVILNKIIKGYTFLNEDLADPRTKALFLIGNLWCVPSLSIFYTYFVSVLGPKFMEKRQPYKLDMILKIYNVLQIICNLYLVHSVSYVRFSAILLYDIRREETQVLNSCRLLNAFVHSVMYTYYMLSSMKINISWKKHITQLQMIQFLILIWHYSKLLWTDCDYPYWITMVMTVQNVVMFILFGTFYYDTYVKAANVPALPKIEANDVLVGKLVSNGKLKEQ